ncbi:SDR family oxidoreductase [Streptomyces sp. NPDC056227]|uniref:SDR family oxidoreductase n=1 Tax=unclassified Streptomyces TaxID=2593676 RepID=UPI0035DEC03E
MRSARCRTTRSSQLSSQRRIPLGRGVPQGVAQLIAFLASDAAAYITGSEYLVDGGWHLNR